MGQVTVRKIVEGRTGLVLRVDLEGDGTGELVNEVIFSPEDLNVVPVPKRIPAFRLQQIWYSMVWFDVSLKVGTLTPDPIWPLARGTDSHVDFRSFGGLIDPTVYDVQPPDTDGKLTLSTSDFILGSIGTIVLELKLTNAASS